MVLTVLTSFAGAQIFGESYGTGTPFVLALHGWGRDHRDFATTLTRPEPAVPSIAVDLPGFGGTPAPEMVWGSREYAEALVPVLAEMADQVIVVGHSFGGKVGVHLAAIAPQNVAGLVFTGVPLFRAAPPQRPPLRFRAVRRLAKSGLVSDDRLEKHRQKYGSADYRAASGVVRDILVKVLSEDYAEPLSQVKCPVELVWGDNDTAAPLVVAERIRDALPNGAHLVVCPGAGHLTPMSVPNELRAAIERLRS
jgi:pimeloyl-ACP methyl ester carboxylesterase